MRRTDQTQTQTTIHCTATVTAVQTSRPRHKSVNRILSGRTQKHRTQFGIHPVHKVVTTAHRTEPSLSRESGHSNVGLNTNENKLRQKPDGIG